LLYSSSNDVIAHIAHIAVQLQPSDRVQHLRIVVLII